MQGEEEKMNEDFRNEFRITNENWTREDLEKKISELKAPTDSPISYLRPVDETFIKTLKVIFQDFEEGDMFRITKAQANAGLNAIRELERLREVDFNPSSDSYMDAVMAVKTEFVN